MADETGTSPCCRKLHHYNCPDALDAQKGVPLHDAVNGTMQALAEGLLGGTVAGALITIAAYVWLSR